MKEQMSTDKKTYKAALIVIGNEILTGRTQDTNSAWIAESLTQNGIDLIEVRVVPDVEDKIIAAVNDLREGADYVFTTGGIGPTHDDITAESVSRALGVAYEHHDGAYQALLEYYGSEEEINDARKKMAMMPKGAQLIPNPVSGAPGFKIENVYVMAGIPRIMQAMFDHIMSNHLEKGALVLSNTVVCSLAESVIAQSLSELQDQYPDVNMGSYPYFRGGLAGVSLVLRSREEEALKEATKALMEVIKSYGDTPKAMSFQAPIDEF